MYKYRHEDPAYPAPQRLMQEHDGTQSVEYDVEVGDSTTDPQSFYTANNSGLSVREAYAVRVLQGLCSNPAFGGSLTGTLHGDGIRTKEVPAQFATCAVLFADALIAALRVPPVTKG